MAKLQRIKRSNGTYNFSVNIPLEIINELVWEKSDKLDLKIIDFEGSKIVIIKNKKKKNG